MICYISNKKLREPATLFEYILNHLKFVFYICTVFFLWHIENIFMYFNISHFHFISRNFSDRKVLPHPDYRRIHLCLFSRACMVLFLKFKFLIHITLTLTYEIKNKSNFVILYKAGHYSSRTYLKSSFFSLMICVAT